MDPRPLIVVLAAVVSSCAAGAPAVREVPPSEPTLALTLDPGMEGARADLEAEVRAALGRARACFERLGLSPDPEPVVTAAVFFRDGASAQRQIAERFGMSPDDVPKTFGGTVDGQTLLATSPRAFESAHKTLYGASTWTSAAYGRLLTHELVHRIHAIAATRLFGTEDGMGPRWFFEGLAIDCAGQFTDRRGDPDADWPELAEVIAAADAGTLPVPFYPTYAELYRSLAARVDVGWMVRAAGAPDFVSRLQRRYTEGAPPPERQSEGAPR